MMNSATEIKKVIYLGGVSRNIVVVLARKAQE
jgi:hypothetical protein